MKIFKSVGDICAAIAETGGNVGFVPTMGALHEGHLSLVERCRRECDAVVVSIFVNPTQFNDKNDLEKYPRTLDNDLALLENAGVDMVFTPGVEDIYPEPDTRVFDFGEIDKVMEGAHRPGHFNGVAQVVSRLFDIVSPSRAYFGEKDFQQLAVIRELERQRGGKIEIIGCPTMRENDGLAMSSRNTLLTPAQRDAASAIYRALAELPAMAAKGLGVEEMKRFVTQEIDGNRELVTEYFEIADPVTLQPLKSIDPQRGARGFAAVKAGSVRLIDNVKIL